MMCTAAAAQHCSALSAACARQACQCSADGITSGRQRGAAVPQKQQLQKLLHGLGTFLLAHSRQLVECGVRGCVLLCYNVVCDCVLASLTYTTVDADCVSNRFAQLLSHQVNQLPVFQ
jgi:hypothetical protein